MKILLITTLYPLSADEYVTSALKDFVDEWQKNGSEVVILRPTFKNTDKKPHLSYVHVLNGKRIPVLETYFVNPIQKLKELNFTPDVVVAHMFKSFIWANKVSSHFKCPLVAGIHNTDLFFARFPHMKMRFKKVFRESNLVACRSDAIKEHFLTQFPEFKVKTQSFPSGIPSSEIVLKNVFSEKIEKLISSREFIFATVGKLQKLKNVDQVLQALSKLPSDFKWTYHIVGDGSELEYLKKLAFDLKLHEKVIFHGWQKKDQVQKILSKSNVYVMISAPETLGLVYLEAMAKGNLIIGAKGWGIDGIIKHGENGFLCTPKDSKELEQILRYFHQMNPDLMRDMSEKTHGTITRYTREETANRYLSAISEASKKHGKGKS